MVKLVLAVLSVLASQLCMGEVWSQNQPEMAWIEEVQVVMANQASIGQCEQEWVQSTDFYQIFSLPHDLPQTSLKLIAATCAQWAYNLTWSFFLVVESKPKGEGISWRLEPLFFTRYSMLQKALYESLQLENFSWDAKDLTLTSRKYLNGQPQCGELGGYRWSPTLQRFETIAIYQNEDCLSPEAAWVKVGSN